MIDGGTGVAVGVGVGVGGGVGVGVGPVTITLNVPLVARISESTVPDVTNGDKSAVDVTMEYCTNVPAGWAGMVAV